MDLIQQRALTFSGPGPRPLLHWRLENGQMDAHLALTPPGQPYKGSFTRTNGTFSEKNLLSEWSATRSRLIPYRPARTNPNQPLRKRRYLGNAVAADHVHVLASPQRMARDESTHYERPAKMKSRWGHPSRSTSAGNRRHTPC